MSNNGSINARVGIKILASWIQLLKVRKVIGMGHVGFVGQPTPIGAEAIAGDGGIEESPTSKDIDVFRSWAPNKIR